MGDLDLEEMNNVNIESTKLSLRHKYKNKTTPNPSSKSSGDLLDDITKVVANQKRSRNSFESKLKHKSIQRKHIKQQTKSGKHKRQFIPTINKMNDSSSRARRISMNKKKNNSLDSSFQSASV